MAIIYAFGTAPQAKAMGYGHLAGTIEGTEEEVLAKFEQMDVCLVKSAQIYGKPQGTYEFGVAAHSGKDSTHALFGIATRQLENAQALFHDFLGRFAACVA